MCIRDSPLSRSSHLAPRVDSTGHALDTSLLQSLLGEAGLHGAVAGAPSWAAADAFSAQV
eukprot:415567-Pleurochrysis_carterae.AAC.1